MTQLALASRYSRLSIGLHWLTLLLFIGVYAAIELREMFPKGTDIREAFKTAHFMLGLSIFVLVWFRIGARLAWRPPLIPVAQHPWQQALAGAVHVALYMLMIGMPLAGWLILSAEGKPVPFFGLSLPPLTGPNEPLAERVEDLHATVGTVGYFLIGGHALAGLVHHYLLRDSTLKQMLPARS